MLTYYLDYHFENGGSVESPIGALLLQAAEVRPQCINQHLIGLIALHHGDQQREA